MKIIHAGAGMLVLLALWAFWLAFQLIPTDLGNSYLVAASVLFSSGAILFALATLGQKIINESQRFGAMARAEPQRPVLRPEPTAAPGAEPMMVDVPPVPAPRAPLAPVLAGAAAGAVAGAALGSAVKPEPESHPDMRLLNELERDLFADLKFSPPEPPAAALESNETHPADLPEAVPPQREPMGTPDPTEDDDLILPPLPPLPSFAAAEPELMPVASEAEIRAIEDAAHHDDDMDDRSEPMLVEPEPAQEIPAVPEPEPAPVPASTSGLIHDEDFARLSEAEADLAPLDTLDVVGAYDSGGTRFTMYSDGSVTAKGEGVDRRFRSLDDLRAFIDGGMRG